MCLDDGLRNAIDALEADIARRRAENALIRGSADAKRESVRECVRRLGCIRDALDIIERISSVRRDVMKRGIEGVVTEALRRLYGDGYSFSMDYRERGNRSSLEMRVLKETPDGTVSRGMEGFGGGVADSVSVPLRVMVLKATDAEDILCLDEAFKHVDSGMVDAVGGLLKAVCDRLDTQVIMLSHHAGLKDYADRCFEMG